MERKEHKITVTGKEITAWENDPKITKKMSLSVLAPTGTFSYGKDDELKGEVYAYGIKINLEGDSPNDKIQFKLDSEELTQILIEAIQKRYGKSFDEIGKGERPSQSIAEDPLNIQDDFFNFNDIEKMYIGRGGMVCRCGCGGNYYYPNKNKKKILSELEKFNSQDTNVYNPFDDAYEIEIGSYKNGDPRLLPFT